MAEIRKHNGRSCIFIDGKPYPPMMATIRTIDGNEAKVDREYYRQLGAAGIKIYFLICDTIWLKKNALELFREEAEILLEVVPDAYIIPRIGLHPTNEWIEAHPEEVLTYDDGSRPGVHLFSESYETDIPAHYSLCSQKWREAAGKVLEETWLQLMALPYADHIAGCFFAAGGTSEWYYMLPMVTGTAADGRYGDFSEAFRRNFSEYLREVYETDEKLQRFWNCPEATIERPILPDRAAHYFAGEVDYDAAQPGRMYTNAPVPLPPGNGTNRGSFPDMDTNRSVYDFYRALHIGTAKSVVYFAELIKRLTPDKLVGAFYGSHGCTNFIRSGTNGGVSVILKSGKVDFLAAPGVYENRAPGGFVGQREFSDSLDLHNMVYIVEEDARTHFENRFFGDRYFMYDMTDSVNVMKRDFGRSLCEGVQAWWFDQLIGGRRYKNETLYRLIAKQQEIAQQAYRLDRRKCSEIAFIYDEESTQAVSNQTTTELVELPRNYEKDRIGAPVDLYYHNDLENPDMPSYKLYVFWNTLVLTAAERRAIRERLAKEHAVALFVYASGVVDPEQENSFSEDYITDLTGIRMKRLDERYDSKFRINGEKHEATKGLDPRVLYGWFDRRRTQSLHAQMLNPESHYDSYLYPLFYSDDPEATVLASFLTSGVPALTLKETDGFTSIFCGAKYLKADLLRRIAAFAGCHIYCDSEDVVYADRNYVVFHSSETGRKTLRFPKKVSPYEVYEEKYYGHDTNEITFETYLGETKMFRLE